MILPTGAITLFLCAIVGSLSIAAFWHVSNAVKILGIATCSLPLAIFGIVCLENGI